MQHGRLIAAALAVLTLAALVPGAASACAAPLSSGDTGQRAEQGVGAAGQQTDWQHTLQVVANVRAAPPSQPLVLIMGGSVVRECVVSESAWAAQVAAGDGPAALTYDLGSRNRTSAQDVSLVRLLPRVPTIVFIGVNVGRFTQRPTAPPTLTLPDPADPLPGWDQHHYSGVLSTAQKRALVDTWLLRRYPLFKKNFTADLALLEKVVRACRYRGFHPVLLDLPRDKAAIGHRMDAPVSRYQRACKALAAAYDIPWVNFNPTAGLVSSDFHDLWHLLPSGQRKWQSKVAAKTAVLLEQYGMGATQ